MAKLVYGIKSGVNYHCAVSLTCKDKTADVNFEKFNTLSHFNKNNVSEFSL